MRIAFYNGVFPQLSQTFVLNHIDYAMAAANEVVVFCGRRIKGIEHPVIDRWNLYRTMRYARPRHVRTFMRVAAGALMRPHRMAQYLLSRKRAGVGWREVSFAMQVGPSPDVIIANFGPNGVSAAATKNAFFPKALLVVIFHGYDLSSYVQEVGWDKYRQAGPSIDLAVCVNRVFLERLTTNVGGLRAVVHHLGVALPEMTKPAGQSRREFAVVFVGRMVEKKGFAYVLQAVRMLVRQGLRLRLHAVGEGASTEEISAILSGEAGDNIVLYGGRDHEFVLKLMSECDCLVAPSVTAADGDQEGIPVTIMEAMAAGLPVVSTRHSGIPELVEDGLSGLLVEERDADALAAAIGRLAESPKLRSKLSAGGRKRVETAFNANVQNRVLFEMVREIVAERSGH
jgi:colanic acid/amylovoran biosynthesis glycosyltransferase